DLMIGNFFMVTCPYLYELDTVAYFALIRNYHSYKTIARIRETTQLLIDVYDCNGEFYVHPLKVWNRYSPTMFLPHLKQADKFTPITDSVEATRALCYMKNPVIEAGKRNLDYWDRLFMKGEELLDSSAPAEEIKKMISLYSNVMISKDAKILSLVEDNFSLEDLLEIKARMIGTGIIGGKAVGMLLARKLLSKNPELKWEKWSEPHDSFYIGSDVFYSYIVQNGWWKLRLEQKTEKGYFEAARVLGEKMLHGKFPEEIRDQFQRIMEYFGQSPIIVRSSSLLEDGFGNAFAGKYDSFFLSNQGTPEERFIKFAEAVRKIYASTMSEDALVYRKQRGLDKLDEQMALLVQ
nr:PEP/pyruvate-binding domain-containing protein [Candidatus Omnitrophota bacterium]